MHIVRATIPLVALLCGACGILASYRSEQKAKDAVSSLLVDSTSAVFRSIAERNNHVCGEVNAKNKVGAFVGFKRFVVSEGNWEALIDPEFDYGDLLSSEGLCTSMRSNPYSSFSTTESVCSDAEEKRRAQIEQDKFDQVWRKNCGAVVRQPFQPELKEEAIRAAPQEHQFDTAPMNAAVDEPATETDLNTAVETGVNDESIPDESNVVEDENRD